MGPGDDVVSLHDLEFIRFVPTGCSCLSVNCPEDVTTHATSSVGESVHALLAFPCPRMTDFNHTEHHIMSPPPGPYYFEIGKTEVKYAVTAQDGHEEVCTFEVNVGI